MSQDEASRTKTLEWVSRKINQTFVALVGRNRFSLSQLIAGGNLVVTDGGDAVDPAGAGPYPPNIQQLPAGASAAGRAYYGQYGNLLCGMVFYDAAGGANSGVVAGNGTLPFVSGISALISTMKPQVQAAGAAGTATFPSTGRGLADRRLKLWDDLQGGLTPDRSMLFAFNQLLAKYIAVFYDAASGKIYRSLIDGFANGSFSRAVMTPGYSLPDLFRSGAGDVFGIRGDPTGSGVLCESLGLILQRLATDINPATQISDHLVSTLSELPNFIRDSFRANLPAFIKLFELVQQQGEFYKQLLAQTGIQAGRWRTPSSAGFAVLGQPIVATGDPLTEIKVVVNANTVTDQNTFAYSNGSTVNSIRALVECPSASAEVKETLVQVIDGIAAGCYSISNAAAEVLRELADEPLYLQTYENSIQDYVARYGKTPLMPLSSALTFLRNLNARNVSNDDRFFPEHSIGDQAFKLMYGTRKMLGRPKSKFSLADAPGVHATLDAYNASAPSREKIDTGRLEQFLTNTVSALRFIVDTRFFRAILAPVEPANLAAGVGGPASIFRVPLTGLGTGILVTGDGANAAFSVRATPQDTLGITESSYQDQALKKISDVVGDGAVTLGQNRAREWIYNIIDMNIIPVNVHALMRGIPLAPLYNYVFTFEQMACLLLGETVGRIENANIDQNHAEGVKNTRQMILKLIIDPYAEVPISSFGGMAQLYKNGSNGLIQRIFRGDDSLMMGRPKFLSDQLYNKALFGSLIPTPYGFDETGPPGASRMEAGYRASSIRI
ncbi:polyprotein pp220, partial [Elysia marginata]